MPIASKLLYFQRRSSPAPPPDPGPEPQPPDPHRRRAGRDPSGARQRRRSSLSSSHHNKPGQEHVPGSQRDAATKSPSLGPSVNITEHTAAISSGTRLLSRSASSDHGRLPDAVQQARERLLQRLNSVDLSGRISRQKTCPLETIWAGSGAGAGLGSVRSPAAEFSSDCSLLGTLTNCFQPGDDCDAVAASKIEEESTAAGPVITNADEPAPIGVLLSKGEPVVVPELERSVCSGGGAEEEDRDGRGCEAAPAECSICLERCCGGGGTGGGDGLTQLQCRHVFHSACLERWLRSRGDCPYCRAAVLGS